MNQITQKKENLADRYRNAKAGDVFIVPADRRDAEVRAANKAGFAYKSDRLMDGMIRITIKEPQGARSTAYMVDKLRDANVGDEFVVEATKRGTMVSTLNKAGWSARSIVVGDGKCKVVIVGHLADDRETVFRELRRLDTHKLKAVLAACKQANLL